MTDRPIIFSGPMIKAILDGRKTVTRRIIKPQPNSGPNGEMVHLGDGSWGLSDGVLTGEWKLTRPGDRLWVREAFTTDGPVVRYAATDDIHELRKTKSPIHMPRWASRITLEVTEVRVQRLQAISEADAEAEGVQPRFADGWPSREHIGGFYSIWASIHGLHGPGSWEANPWVAALTFKLANKESSP